MKIDNSDELSCARAIVTMKEYVDGDPDKQYVNLRRGRPIQGRLAKQLHREAGVPEGPCGYEELEKFQTFLGRQGYKIIVVEYVSFARIFQGNVDEYDKVIYLVKHGAHSKVLKAACLKFIQEFKDEAGFNPIEKRATVTSACNLFWRRHLIPEDTIAIAPLNSWRGANVNQSKAALEWLSYEDFKLGENRLRHVRNGGEQKVITPGKAMFGDGYDAETKTVYEFHGCFFHGCPKCFPNHRQRNTIAIQIIPSQKSMKPPVKMGA